MIELREAKLEIRYTANSMKVVQLLLVYLIIVLIKTSIFTT